MFVEDYLVDLRRARFTPRAITYYVRRIVRRVRATLIAHPELARSVGVTALGILVGAFLWALVLSFRLSPGLAHRFFVFQAAWLAITMSWVVLHLGLFRDADGRMPRRLGAATILTLVRLELVPGLVTLILAQLTALAVVAYLVAGATDVLDGWVARRFRQESRFGAVLDPLVDIAVGVGVFWGLVSVHLLPPWLFALVAARYLLLLGGAFYIIVFHGPVRIRPTVLGKFSGVLIHALTALVLLAPALPQRGALPQIRDLSVIAFAFLFAANMVQLVLIGILNLRHLHRPVVHVPPPLDPVSAAS